MLNKSYANLILENTLKITKGDLDEAFQIIHFFNAIKWKFEGDHLLELKPIKHGVLIHLLSLGEIKVLIKCDKDLDSLSKGIVDYKYQGLKKTYYHNGVDTIYLPPSTSSLNIASTKLKLISEDNIFFTVKSFLKILARKRCGIEYDELYVVDPFR